ncbi:Hypothetical protein R9X50_00227700 [Acrodontium crateriforme]|uniref:Uncharacterized protein n=1 Tax=Acrodontium crateriforme TaxID=150365 RepID=A0AAQ3M0P4_9PEZI|nr:Hypothetical protein R9X50_00227700 [Acrodontium crateriforme]
MKSAIIGGLLASLVAATPVTLEARGVRGSGSNCFPLGDSARQLPKDYSKPSVSRQDWWCTYAQTYGFLGFSFPLEDSDCSAYSNSYDSMNDAFARMKKDFGASMVRVYAPECRQASVWENLLKAGVNNNMAVIPQIWWGFDSNQDLWKQSQTALFSIMDKYPIAPYVFHSVEFGSEPIGDYVDGNNFVSDFQAFKVRMNDHYGVPVAISEDWDRPGRLTTNNGQSLTDLGNQIKAISQQVHAHIMPYYHGKNLASSWDYIKQQVPFYKNVIGLPTFISESMWAWGTNQDHQGGDGDVGPDQYARYWYNMDDNCQFFKQYQVGWFIHTWQGEDTFDDYLGNGKYEINPFRPRPC